MLLPFSFAGAVLGCLAVVLGAFGAHALKTRLEPNDLVIFETGVRYQTYHALALFACDLVLNVARSRGSEAAVAGLTRWAGWSFVFGVAVFSGTLYLLVLTGIRRFGMITPIGGLGLVAGWALLAFATWRLR